MTRSQSAPNPSSAVEARIPDPEAWVPNPGEFFGFQEFDPVHIRAAVAVDHRAVASFCESHASRSRGVGGRLRDEQIRRAALERWPRCGQGPVTLLAERAGKIVGVAIALPSADPRIADFGILVAPAHRGRGVGVTLLGELARRCRHRGVASLRGETPTSDRHLLGAIVEAGFAIERRGCEHGMLDFRVPLADPEVAAAPEPS